MQQLDKQRESFDKWLRQYHADHFGEESTVEDYSWDVWQAAQQAQWLPIETAPADRPFLAVLDCAGERTICTMRLSVAKQKNSVPNNGDFHRERVTHWMPLPQGPNVVD